MKRRRKNRRDRGENREKKKNLKKTEKQLKEEEEPSERARIDGVRNISSRTRVYATTLGAPLQRVAGRAPRRPGNGRSVEEATYARVRATYARLTRARTWNNQDR